MSYRFLDGQPVAHHPRVADVIIQRGSYQCGACGSALRFEPCDIAKASYAIGACLMGHDCGDPACKVKERNCPMWKVRLKIPLERLKCEVLA